MNFTNNTNYTSTPTLILNYTAAPTITQNTAAPTLKPTESNNNVEIIYLPDYTSHDPVDGLFIVSMIFFFILLIILIVQCLKSIIRK